MTDPYEKIREALAMGPTPGPWGLTELPRDIQRDGYKFAISRNGLGWRIAKVTHEANGGSGVANATYIAACDPDTIRELLAERDQLAAALEAAREDGAEAKQNGYELGLLAGAQEAERLRGVIARYERKLDAAIDQARGKGGVMDRTMQMVYETEGQHGADIRGWHGREAQMWAMQRDRDQEEYEQAMQEQYEADMRLVPEDGQEVQS